MSPIIDVKDFLTLYNAPDVVICDVSGGESAKANYEKWMLKALGHTKVQVLNGGLAVAKKHGVPINAEAVPIKQADTPYPSTDWQLPLVDMAGVEKMANDPNCLVVDVRDTARYEGKAEPIDLIAGHIPQAVNVPFRENLDSAGQFLPVNDLRAKYEKIFGKIAPQNIAVHCGSGITACHTLLALDYAGLPMPKLYVGSWSEWSRNDKPMVTLASGVK